MEKRKIIGKSCSPSTIISHEKIKSFKVLINYADGIRGANKTYYCLNVQRTTEFKKLPLDFWILTLLTEKIIEVNPANIVEMSEQMLVKIVSDVTAHRNYYSTTCKKCVETEYLELNRNEEYKMTDEYIGRERTALQYEKIE